MLAVQQFLQTKTFDDLTAELGITVKQHDTLPLTILNYDQIESPKTHPVVRECRALVLHTDTKEIVARSFSRFFNLGEVQEEMKDFDFSDFIVQSKEDGSLVLLYHFDGQWHANTRGSFGVDQIATGVNMTWRDAFCKALGVSGLHELNPILDPHMTYVCEFCSPWNKIVRRYEQPTMYLLTGFSKLNNWQEVPVEHCDWCASAFDDGGVMMRPALFKRPTRYHFKSIEEVQKFLDEQAAADPTFEGVVIKDRHGHRWKIKSATYLGLHKLRGEGDNLYNPKNLLPFIMSGEDDELLTYYPEVKEAYYALKAEVLGEYIKVLETWIDHFDKEEQKEFALAVQGKTPLTSILFNVRKKVGAKAKSADFKQAWRDAEGQLLKRLKA